MLLLFYGGSAVTTEQHSPADVLRHWLIQEGYGTENGSEWPIFCPSEPAAPDNCITCKDTTGIDLGRIQYSGEREQRPGVQIRVRGRTHNVAWVKAKELSDALNTELYNSTVSIDGVVYLLETAKRTSNVLPIGYESPTTRRNVCTVNTLLCLRRVN